MLIVSQITKQFAGEDTPILDNINFVLNKGERMGLIGPNGAGKSTLFRIIMGQVSADKGSVMFDPPDVRIGYLAQGMAVSDDTPVEEILFPQICVLQTLEEQIAHLSQAMARGDEQAAEGYAVAVETISKLGHAIDKTAGERIMGKLGLSDVLWDSPVRALSGGQKTRLNLAAILLSNPQLLVMDEPTNHLDIRGLEWLETWLNEFTGSVLIASHDRTFLDRVTNHIVAIDPLTASARVFVGNYSAYLETLRREREKQWGVWRDQETETARLKQDAQRTMGWADMAHAADAPERAKKHARRAKAKEMRLQRYLESDDRVEKPAQTWQMKIDFDRLPRAYGDALRLEEVSIGYGKPLLYGLNMVVRGGEKVAIVGPNGHGKSTLLKTITGQIPLLSGRIRLGSGIQMGYLAQEQEILDPSHNALDVLQAQVKMSHTEARAFLHYFLFAQHEVFRPIAQLSYGERTRLMLALLVGRGCNLLVMDEPLNHLDLPSREKFESALMAFPGSVLMVSHDRYFIERFATVVWHMEDGELHQLMAATA